MKVKKEYFIEDLREALANLIKDCPPAPPFKRIVSLANENRLIKDGKRYTFDFSLTSEGKNLAHRVYEGFNIRPDSQLFPKVVKIPFDSDHTKISLDYFLDEMTYKLSCDLRFFNKKAAYKVAQDIIEGKNLNEKILVLSFVTGIKIYEDAIDQGFLRARREDEMLYVTLN